MAGVPEAVRRAGQLLFATGSAPSQACRAAGFSGRSWRQSNLLLQVEQGLEGEVGLVEPLVLDQFLLVTVEAVLAGHQVADDQKRRAGIAAAALAMVRIAATSCSTLSTPRSWYCSTYFSMRWDA